MVSRKAFVPLLVLLALLGSEGAAQSVAPTTNILSRVLMVESQYGRGTIFSLDVDQREYWITAKHILTGARHPPYGSVTSKSASLRILDPGGQGEQWLSVNFSVIDAGNDIDIVILAPPVAILKNPLPSMSVGSNGIVLGGDCEFLGFPYGGGWRADFPNSQSIWMPFVKHCNLSAAPNVEPKIWVLDGINNAGFSGGPVVFNTGSEQKILAVVSGYYLEPTEVFSSAAERKVAVTKSSKAKKPRTQLKVNLNSGFVIAYDIKYVMKAIKSSPVGPLRQ
jgi:hypothetical protein